VAEDDAHARTLAAYEAGAAEWRAARGAPRLDEARAFAAFLDHGDGPVVDLGCGPGWHLPVLDSSAAAGATIALDGAAAMLGLVAEHAAGAPRVRADLRALPFARHALGAVWANKAYVHLDRRRVPLALWDLHRCLRVGGRAALGLFGGDEDHAGFDDDPLAGRAFSRWPADLLDHVLVGAGFDVLELVVGDEPDVPSLRVTVRARRTLADVVGPDLRLLLVGLNPSLYAADVGVGFARPGNRAWPALVASGLATVDRDPIHLLRHHRIGMTDLVKRATARADELAPEEFRAGLGRLDALCRWLRPGAVCVLGVTGWRAATGDRRAGLGPQERTVGGRPVYVMPNPSGLNAHTDVDDLAAHFRTAATLGDTAA
jgi:TDG/mug DNA glycosylase family protein